MKSLYRQFSHPTGPLGVLVGHIMALKNKKRGDWVVSLLDLRQGERVLEIGYGPGADANKVLERLGPYGDYCGVDASEAMVRLASRRNRKAVASGRARFDLGRIDDGLPFPAQHFDAVLAINCAQFWQDLHQGFRELARVTKSGGRLVVAVQPRNRGATPADSERWGEKLAAAARSAGLVDVAVVMGPTEPPVAAVRAKNP